jgi:hypothetical protein
MDPNEMEEEKDYFDIYEDIANKSLHRQPKKPPPPPESVITFTNADAGNLTQNIRTMRILSSKPQLTEAEARMKEELRMWLASRRIFI